MQYLKYITDLCRREAKVIKRLPGYVEVSSVRQLLVRGAVPRPGGASSLQKLFYSHDQFIKLNTNHKDNLFVAFIVRIYEE